MRPRRPTTPAEIEAGQTPAGGFTDSQLRAWGVRCPPKSGWRKRLLQRGVPASCPYPEGLEAEPGASVPSVNPLLAYGPRTAATEMPSAAIEIFADGSCDRRSSRGGWGFVVFDGARIVHEASGGVIATTNNRMELVAVIEALRWLDLDVPAIVWTDAAYVVRVCEAWRLGWRRDSWTRSPAKALANMDLRQGLEDLLVGRAVDVRWIRGHAGSDGNERADTLAKAACLRR